MRLRDFHIRPSMRKTLHRTILIGSTAFLALTGPMFAQNPSTSKSSNMSSANTSNAGNSLGSVARNLQGGKATTKRVFTNDDMEAPEGPLPRLNLNISQRENSGEIVTAFLAYRQTHTPKQTEDTLHEWFDLYDRTLADAIVGFNNHQSARQTSAKAMHEPCPTGEFAADCEKEERAAVNNLLKSDPVLNQDNRVMGRIQSGLKDVRLGLWMKNIRYGWFTIRNSDGYGVN